MKQHLMKVSEACDYYDVGKNCITSYASQYKKTHGLSPTWYVVGEKRHDVRIDIIEIERLCDIERKLWMYVTDTLYWELIATGMSQTALSRLLAEASNEYKSESSWNVWMSNSLFNLPPRLVLSEGKSRIAELAELGDQILSTIISRD